MSNETGIQVANKEAEMAGMVAAIAQFLQDATQLPTLRKQLEVAQTEIESLKRSYEDAQVEIGLEREAHAKTLDESREWKAKAGILGSKLTSLQHKFDTINGVVMAAMAEIERDKPKPVIEIVKEEPKPWTPSSPISSVGY